MSETPSTITDLQARWHTLNDLDRAKAIFTVIHSGNISQRKLAMLLNCSASLIRHLLLAAQARPEDRPVARKCTTRLLNWTVPKLRCMAAK